MVTIYEIKLLMCPDGCGTRMIWQVNRWVCPVCGHVVKKIRTVKGVKR